MKMYNVIFDLTIILLGIYLQKITSQVSKYVYRVSCIL